MGISSHIQLEQKHNTNNIYSILTKESTIVEEDTIREVKETVPKNELTNEHDSLLTSFTSITDLKMKISKEGKCIMDIQLNFLEQNENLKSRRN